MNCRVSSFSPNWIYAQVITKFVWRKETYIRQLFILIMVTEFLVMPFGLTNAPTTFQATMNRIFPPFLRNFVSVFLDDILIYSKTWEDHLHHLRLVLETLRTRSFFAKLTKCDFCKDSVHYLGHVISAKGVEVDNSKIDTILSWPLPYTIKQLPGF